MAEANQFALPPSLFEVIEKKAEEFTQTHFKNPTPALSATIVNAMAEGVRMGLELAGTAKPKW